MSDPASLEPGLENLPDNLCQYDLTLESHTLHGSPPSSLEADSGGNTSETTGENVPGGVWDVSEEALEQDIYSYLEPASSNELKYGIVVKTFSSGCPTVARLLLRSMKDIGRGFNILPQGMETDIMHLAFIAGVDLSEWRQSFYQFKPNDDLVGHIPDWKNVHYIYQRAAEITKRGGCELAWNLLHLCLVDAVLENGRKIWDLFGCADCTDARPHRQLEVSSSSPYDLCDISIYSLAMRHETGAQDRLERLRRYSPTQTVNHTDSDKFPEHPHLLSIEGTSPGVHGDDARLQLGLWHAAQWSFLAWAVGQKIARREMDKDGSEPHVEGEDAGARARSLESEKHDALRTLGFLPGIIVQGHHWYFVLSTFNPVSGKTTLFADQHFGSTQDHIGIYSVVAGLRQLLTWATDGYLEWFDQHVLPA